MLHFMIFLFGISESKHEYNVVNEQVFCGDCLKYFLVHIYSHKSSVQLKMQSTNINGMNMF